MLNKIRGRVHTTTFASMTRSHDKSIEHLRKMTSNHYLSSSSATAKALSCSTARAPSTPRLAPRRLEGTADGGKSSAGAHCAGPIAADCACPIPSWWLSDRCASCGGGRFSSSSFLESGTGGSFSSRKMENFPAAGAMVAGAVGCRKVEAWGRGIRSDDWFSSGGGPIAVRIERKCSSITAYT